MHSHEHLQIVVYPLGVQHDGVRSQSGNRLQKSVGGQGRVFRRVDHDNADIFERLTYLRQQSLEGRLDQPVWMMSNPMPELVAKRPARVEQENIGGDWKM